jgi:hypothetical protein
LAERQTVGGQQVIANGVLLVGGDGSTEGTVAFDDLAFTFSFIRSDTPAQIQLTATGMKTLTLVVSGNLVGGLTWWLPNLGTWRNQSFGLLCVLRGYTSNPAGPAAWEANYSFRTHVPAGLPYTSSALDGLWSAAGR